MPDCPGQMQGNRLFVLNRPLLSAMSISSAWQFSGHVLDTFLRGLILLVENLTNFRRDNTDSGAEGDRKWRPASGQIMETSGDASIACPSRNSSVSHDI